MWKMFPEALNVNGARLRTCPVHWQTTKVLGSSNTQPSARFKPLADELSIWVTVLDHVRQVLVKRNFLFKLVGPLNPGQLTAISKLGKRSFLYIWVAKMNRVAKTQNSMVSLKRHFR